METLLGNFCTIYPLFETFRLFLNLKSPNVSEGADYWCCLVLRQQFTERLLGVLEQDFKCRNNYQAKILLTLPKKWTMFE